LPFVLCPLFPCLFLLQWSANKCCSLLKFMMNPIVLTFFNPKVTNKFPHHPPILREREFKETKFLIKKNNISLLITIHRIKDRNVSMYSILTRKHSLNTHVALFWLLFSTVWCLSGKNLVAVNQYTWAPFSTYRFSVWEIF
jgi:hypothetical protein